jgi:hypothetical protein
MAPRVQLSLLTTAGPRATLEKTMMKTNRLDYVPVCQRYEQLEPRVKLLVYSVGHWSLVPSLAVAGKAVCGFTCNLVHGSTEDRLNGNRSIQRADGKGS